MIFTARPGPSGASAAPSRHLCVVLHDVSPAQWEACRRLIVLLRAVAVQVGQPLPLTLLVVPMMHGDAAGPAPYLRWLHRQQYAGHELALHGWTHRDDGPPARSLGQHLLRRVYTAGEGEFAALAHAEAAARLARARHWAAAHGLAAHGFVAPAWLLNAAAERAVRDAGFTHLATRDRIVALPEDRALRAPALVFSTRSRWRRAASVLWNHAQDWQCRAEGTPLLRLELHPADADHPAVARCWQHLLARALRERTPLRLAEAAALARASGVRPGRAQPVT